MTIHKITHCLEFDQSQLNLPMELYENNMKLMAKAIQ